MNIYSIFFGFISGVLVSLIAAFINHKIKMHSEATSKLRASEYQLMLKLGELHQEYFWLATNELHGVDTDMEVIARIYDIASEIAKELHQNEESEFTDDLLRIIYDESYDSYTKRWKDMDRISDRMAAKLRPRHKSIIKSLNESNIILMAQPNFKSKAPANGRFRLRM